MTVQLACIVEGHGEVGAVPVLIRRIAAEVSPAVAVRILHPIRVPRSRLLRPGEPERTLQIAALSAGERGAIMILLDADDDCPAELAPELLARANRATNTPVAVVLPKCEFEAWFLAAAESLRGVRGLNPGLLPPDIPEAVRGAKEWLRQRMPADRKYVETLDQPALSQRMDLAAARRAKSFDKFYREIARLLWAATLR